MTKKRLRTVHFCLSSSVPICTGREVDVHIELTSRAPLVTCWRCRKHREWKLYAVGAGMIPHAWVTEAVRVLAEHDKTEADVLWVANSSGMVNGSWKEWIEEVTRAPDLETVIVGDGWWLNAICEVDDCESSVVWRWREPPIYRPDAKNWRDRSRS